MLYYGLAILAAQIAMLVISIRLCKRTMMFGGIFTAIFTAMIMFHVHSLAQHLNRPADNQPIANQHVSR